MIKKISVCSIFLCLLSSYTYAQEVDDYNKYSEMNTEVRAQIIDAALDYAEAAKRVYEQREIKQEVPDIDGIYFECPEKLHDVKTEEGISQKKDIAQKEPSEKETRDNIVSKELDSVEMSFKFTTGYRADDFRWSISGDNVGGNPNVISELLWRDIRSYQIGAKGNALFYDRFRLEGSLGYGWIVSGNNTDKDFAGDNRTLEFSRSHSQTKEDSTFDASVGLGYEFNLIPPGKYKDFLADELTLAVLGGLSKHSLRFKDRKLYQEIPNTGSYVYSDVNKSYEGTYKGPWLGLELSGSRLNFAGYSRFEYHWADYFAEADWLLRTDFQHPVSFVQESDGTGVIFSVGGQYDFNKTWSLGGDFVYQDWGMTQGITRFFLANGTTPEQQLNEVKWRSYTFLFSATCHFDIGKKDNKDELSFLEETDIKN